MTTRVLIGDATLYLGDCYQILPTLGWFDALCFDPPYEFDNSGGGAFRKARGNSDTIIAEGLTEGFEYWIINPLMCGGVVCFHHGEQRHALEGYLRGCFHRVVLLRWIKENPAPHRNKNYLADAEDWFHAWNRGWEPVGDHHDMHRQVSAPVRPSKLHDHPTVKPDAVMDKILRNLAGETVCDPFMGTGSTGVAAIRAGRRFTGIEWNPKHFETACRRIEAAVLERKAA